VRVLKLILRNSLRHSLRTGLTILGVAIAVTAFCVIRSAIGAWYLQAEASSPNRLVSRNAISITFDMPLAYADRIASVPGVTGVSHISWFGGIYIDQRNFFPKYAVDHTTYFKLYPEFVIPPDQWQAFSSERNAVIVGRQLADRYGWKVGDQIRITGDIYPGDWDFVIRGIYTGAQEDTDESAWFFRFDYLDERMRETWPGRAGRIGMVVEQIDDPSRAAQISQQIDALFANSLAETKTETEKAFILGFISMSTQIILGLRIISFLVIGIILLVMANTLAMAARERVNEYALLKTLGFRPFHIVGLVYGESLTIAAIGGVLGLALSYLVVPLLEAAVGTFLPKLPLSAFTLGMGMTSAIVVGLLAAIFPTIRALRTSIVEGLRPID
jgi:putative ABC transport system permease protein